MPSISDTDLQRCARPCGCSAHHPVCTPRPDRRRSVRVTNLMYLSRAKGRPHGPRVFTRTPTEAALVYECRRAGTARSRGRGRGTSKRELLIALRLQWTLNHPRLHQPVRCSRFTPDLSYYTDTQGNWQVPHHTAPAGSGSGSWVPGLRISAAHNGIHVSAR